MWLRGCIPNTQALNNKNQAQCVHNRSEERSDVSAAVFAINEIDLCIYAHNLSPYLPRRMFRSFGDRGSSYCHCPPACTVDILTGNKWLYTTLTTLTTLPVDYVHTQMSIFAQASFCLTYGLYTIRGSDWADLVT